MSSRKWVKIWGFITMFALISVGVFNYLMDPLWLFSHKFSFNNIQSSFSERQQKTNLIHFRNVSSHDGVLVGSSRSTFINQNDFTGMRIFNYAVDSMNTFEYKGYIDFFKNNIKNLDYIIIGADFYNTNTPKNITAELPKYYIENTQAPLYRLKTLISSDALNYSIRNIKNYFRDSKDNKYNRDNVRYRNKASEEDRLRAYTKNIKRHTSYFVGQEYKYNPQYLSILNAVKNDNPDAKIIIFTSPISADLLVSIIKNGKRLEEYRKWLNDLVDIFGSVYHFMDINSITTNLDNYPDDDHYYPWIGTFVANRVSGKTNDNIPDDFGILLNKCNLDDYLSEFEKEVRLYKNPLPIR